MAFAARTRRASARWTARMTSSPTYRPVSSSAAMTRIGAAQGPMAPTNRSAARNRNEAELLIEGARVPLRGVLVSSAIGQTLHRLGGDVVFGLMGSGNLAVTNAMGAAR